MQDRKSTHICPKTMGTVFNFLYRCHLMVLCLQQEGCVDEVTQITKSDDKRKYCYRQSS